jgi:hypothetical protein
MLDKGSHTLYQSYVGWSASLSLSKHNLEQQVKKENIANIFV